MNLQYIFIQKMKWSAKIRKFFSKSKAPDAKFTVHNEKIEYSPSQSNCNSFYSNDQSHYNASSSRNQYENSFSSLSDISLLEQHVPATHFLFEQLQKLAIQTNFEIRRLDCEGLLSNFDALRHVVIIFTILAETNFQFPNFTFVPVPHTL